MANEGHRGFRLRLAAVTACLAAVAGAAPSMAGPPPPSKCPAPKTCDEFVLDPARWPADAAGRVVIPYLVNPAGRKQMAEGDFIAAVQAAAGLWERANPRLHFKYEGTTSLLPGVPDGSNVVAFGATPPPFTGVANAAAEIFSQDGVITEADIVLAVERPWTAEQCAQRDNSCGKAKPLVEAGSITSITGLDVVGVLAHEFGHWLSLGHPDSTRGRELTMYGSGSFDLRRQTLGLGDILGARAAYPCGRCKGKPVVFAP
jgi:hypothetical protein